MSNTCLILFSNLPSFLKRKEEISRIILREDFLTAQISSPTGLSIFILFFNFIFVNNLLVKQRLRVITFVTCKLKYLCRRYVCNFRPRNSYSYVVCRVVRDVSPNRSHMPRYHSSLVLTIKKKTKEMSNVSERSIPVRYFRILKCMRIILFGHMSSRVCHYSV